VAAVCVFVFVCVKTKPHYFTRAERHTRTFRANNRTRGGSRSLCCDLRLSYQPVVSIRSRGEAGDEIPVLDSSE
jgi:hypothetical protein